MSQRAVTHTNPTNEESKMNLPASTLTKRQTSNHSKALPNGGRIVAHLRHDDQCGNGHNTFSMTCTVYSKGGREESGGCQHDLIEEHFPSLRHMIKWHLTSTDGPMHYVANTVYHATEIPAEQDVWYFSLESKVLRIVGKEERAAMEKKYGSNATFEMYANPQAKAANVEHARSTAVWPNASPTQLQNKAALLERLPGLMLDFRGDVETLGFVY